MSNWIEENIEFQTYLSIADCKILVFDYFNSLGFKKSHSLINSIDFKRGSEIQNGFTTNPLKWMSLINVNFEKKSESVKIVANFKINTKNQIVTQNELEIWNLVIKQFVNSLQAGTIDSSELHGRNKKVKRGSLILIAWSILGIIIGGGLGIYLAIITKVRFLIPILIILFALVFIIFGFKRMNRSLKQ
jgi:hypothetical protein